MNKFKIGDRVWQKDAKNDNNTLLPPGVVIEVKYNDIEECYHYTVVFDDQPEPIDMFIDMELLMVEEPNDILREML